MINCWAYLREVPLDATRLIGASFIATRVVPDVQTEDFILNKQAQQSIDTFYLGKVLCDCVSATPKVSMQHLPGPILVSAPMSRLEIMLIPRTASAWSESRNSLRSLISASI